MTSGTHALILAQSAFEAVCKERDEALALLASEKSTRNAIIAKGVEMEKQLEAMREAIKDAHYALGYVYNNGEGSCAFPYRTDDDLCSENRFHHVKDALDALKTLKKP